MAEWLYLFILIILIPFSVGLQIFSKLSFILSLVLVSVLQAPSVILLYRWLIPFTIIRKRIWLFLALLPVYLLVYELNARLAYFFVIAMQFVPQAYRNNLSSAHPYDLTHIFIQNIDYTFLIILSAFAFLLMKELFKRQHTVDQLTSDKLRLELNQLKAQIQPHFFFNTLNNLYTLSLQGSPKTSVSIANLSDIMRYVLYNAQQEKVLLAKEIGFMHSYLDLERIRHTDENAIEFSVQGNPNGLLIAPLLFLPLIENSFKHSLQKKIPGNKIRIIMAIDEAEIIFQTSNLTGVHAGAQKIVHEGGIGLQNVRKRLELLYSDHHQLAVFQENASFIVTLSIQLNRQI